MKNLRITLVLCAFFIFVNKSYSKAHSSIAEHPGQQNPGNSVASNSPLIDESLRADLYAINSDSSISLEDGTLELYNTSYCDCVNWFEDSKKISNFLENFAIARDGQIMAIEKRQPIGTSDTVFYYMSQMRQKSYKILFSAIGLNHPNLFGVLQDSYTGTSTPINLNGTTAISFSVTADPATSNPYRFRLVFSTLSIVSTVSGVSGVVPVTYTTAKAWQQNNDIAVEWQVDNEVNVSKYTVEKSLDGINFDETSEIQATGKSSSTYNWVDIDPSTGDNFYRIKEVNDNGGFQYSKVLKVTEGKAGSNISVYPNPVVSGQMSLQMVNMVNGNYNVRLLNTFGQVVLTKLINHKEGSSTETISVNTNLNKGVYRLEVIHPDNKVSNINVVF